MKAPSAQISEKEALIALNHLAGMGPVRIASIKRVLGEYKKVFDPQSEELYKEMKLSGECIEQINAFSFSWIDKELKRVEKFGARIVCWEEPDYPEQLKNIPHPPPVLYIAGRADWNQGRGFAIVGARRASLYGLGSAERMAYQLALNGLTIISGMARGIDSASHRGAIKSGGNTVAVLGSGLMRIYPTENMKLAREIMSSGALITECSMECPPLSPNFPRRNRIISGLSLGVLVVEAAKKAGSLITVDYAKKQGRKCFALPGRVDSVTSQGTNRLIKKNEAIMINEASEILEELGILRAEQKQLFQGDTADIINAKDSLYQWITSEGIHIDQLCGLTGFTIADVTSQLTKLELMGKIRQLSGQIFVRR